MELVVIILIAIISVLIDFVLIFLDIINYINVTPLMLLSVLFGGGIISIICLIVSIICELICIHKGGNI